MIDAVIIKSWVQAHEPCAAALSGKHSEHRMCKMCGFDQKYGLIENKRDR